MIQIELHKLWDAYGKGDRFVGFLLLMIYSGMMPGELFKFEADMVNWEKNEIVGCGLKTKKRKETPIVFPDMIAPIIQDLIDWRNGKSKYVLGTDTDDTFNFVVAIMYSQLFNLLCDKADDVYNGRLPVHVRCLLDEFANIGQIPKFDKLIATIRSREISASIILQSQSQLKTIYKDAADIIVGNCDSTLFLGGKEKSTLKEISEILGKETIDLYNTSETRSTNNSYGLNYQKTGKQLMSEDEIAVMDGGKCILQLRGVRPFLSDKFDITKHPKYKLLSDYDKRNAFDIEKYRLHRLVVKPTQTFDLYDMGEVEAE